MHRKHVPFEKYLNIPVAYGASFSADNSQLAFISTLCGIPEVWSVPLDAQSHSPVLPQRLTFEDQHIITTAFSPSMPWLLVASDVNGNEKIRLSLLSSDGSSRQNLIPQPNITNLFLKKWSPDGKSFIYSNNQRDPRYFDVYEYSLETGKQRLILCSNHTNYAVAYSLDGTKVLISRFETKHRNHLISVDLSTYQAEVITDEAQGDPALYVLPAWSLDGQGLFVLSNYERQFLSFAFFDISTKRLRYLLDEPWDVEILELNHFGTRLALITNEDGISKLRLFDVTRGWEARQELPHPSLSDGVISEVSWSKEGKFLAISFTAADTPSTIQIWDTEQAVLWHPIQQLSDPRPRLQFVAPSHVHYPTFDQRRIPALLYLPENRSSLRLPIIIDVHGGPESQARPTFNPVTQYLLACGYGVLAPNIRGSTGYGYEYQGLDDKYLRMNAVEDIRCAAYWLTKQGLADPDRIALMGISYGGFIVLAALAKYPELWAAGVDISGIVNFITFLQRLRPGRRRMREAEYGELEKDRSFLEEISPINSVHRITAPLLVIHGANDSRVPVEESEQIVSALSQRSVPVKYFRLDDEGHGLFRPDNIRKVYPAIVQFLNEYVLRSK